MQYLQLKPLQIKRSRTEAIPVTSSTDFHNYSFLVVKRYTNFCRRMRDPIKKIRAFFAELMT
jgi:hypothetical protein